MQWLWMSQKIQMILLMLKDLSSLLIKNLWKKLRKLKSTLPEWAFTWIPISIWGKAAVAVDAAKADPAATNGFESFNKKASCKKSSDAFFMSLN